MQIPATLKFIAVILISLQSSQAYSQITDSIIKKDYLAFQTGFIIDSYNSVGVRTFFEYQKDLTKNWQYGISYEHSRHLGRAATDVRDQLATNLSLISFNYYYKVRLWKDRLFWTSGLGIGGVHAYWGEDNKFGITLNASSTLNIKLSKKIYLESSPFLVLLPVNRVYFSSMDANTFNSFYAFTLLPVGIKVKL